MLLSALIPILATMAVAYPIKENNVNCRTGPTTNDNVVRQYNQGDDVTLVCQTKGTSINGDTTWGKTSDGCFVADWLIQTGTSDFVVAACDAGTAPPPPASNGDGYCKTVNAAGLALIKEFEGFVPNVYNDPVGYPTVGYGHLCKSSGCAEVKYGFPLSEETGTALLNDDIPNYTSCMADALKVAINDNQWAALTSFTYNMGCGAFADSDLVKRINAGEDPATVASSELPQWVHAGGQVLDGLVRRRNAELALFKTPSSKQAFPKCT